MWYEGCDKSSKKKSIKLDKTNYLGALDTKQQQTFILYKNKTN